MNRREMVRRLMLAGGAGIALPGVAKEHSLADRSVILPRASRPNPQTSNANWKPKFLDPHQNETMIVLAERIIPGSGKAQVNRFIDLLLSVDTQDSQRKFLASLSAFEAEAIRQFLHPYKDLTEVQQDRILTSASTTERGEPAENSQQVTLHDHFENMKEWVAKAYYSSEIGMKELGWTGQVYFTDFTGCQQSEK